MDIRKKSAAGVAALISVAAAPSAMAATPSIDVTGATTYLDTEVGPAMVAIASVVFSLAALAMGIRWVKATFFS